MRHHSRWLVGITIVALPLWSCQSNPGSEASAPPARVEAMNGTQPSRVILTEQGVERLDLQTMPVVRLEGPDPVTSAVPYGAVIYDAQGDAWVYASGADRTFIRQAISIESIVGDRAYLSDGPDEGTQVVSVGAAELFGTEFNVGP